MQSDPQTITVTVKVPFVGDRTLTINTLETVKDLTESVVSTCQAPSLPDTPHCIVQSGRILSENSTLQEAGVSNGTVLHLMPRPRDSNRVPRRGGSARARASRSNRNDGSNSGNVSDASHDDDDDSDEHEHHHHHHGEHHVHTNVIIGHVAVDGRIQYRDAHDMLLSVLHAIGFSTRAVRAAAAVAAAVATAMQSSEERAAASRTVLQTAWQGTRSLQEQFARDRDATSTDARGSDMEAAQPTPVQSPPGDSAGTSTSHGKESAAEPEQSQTTTASAAPDNIANTSLEPRTTTLNLEASGSEATPALLPEDPPPVGDGDTVLHASERAADRLLPVVADLMETAALRIRNAPSVIDLEGSDRLGSAQRLTEDLGSVAGVVTVVTTLISTLLPDPDDLRTSSSRNGRAQGSGNRHHGSESAGGNETANSNVQNETTNPSGVNGQQQGQARNTGSNQSSRPSRTQNRSSGDNESRSASRSFNLFPFGPPSEQNQREQSQEPSRSNRRVRRSRRVRVSSSQAANADFMIRVLSYYFCSLSDAQLPEGSGPPEIQGQTAVSVLDGLYGRNNTARPTNILLQVVHTAMRRLTPRQFHEILQGNMLPLGAIRRELWEEISRVIRAENNADIEGEEVEEVLVDDICEVLHEFVHILESEKEANEEGVFTPGPEEFCHHIMHTIQRKVESLARILARSGSQQEFARRMSHWIKNAVGEVLHAISSELEMQWDGLLNSFRRAVYEIGNTVVGSQFSVIFPYIANLLANRAKQLHQAAASPYSAGQQIGERGTGSAGANGEADRSNCGCSDCENHVVQNRPDLLDTDDESYDETDSDMPGLDEVDSGDDFSDNSGYEEADLGRERGDSTARNIVPGLDKDVFCELGDAEQRDLAKELVAEAKPTEISSTPEDILHEIDFKAMASALISEDGSSFTKSVPVPSSSRSTTVSRENPTMTRGATNMTPILSTSGPVPSLPASAGRATLSSAAVPRGGSSTSVQKKEFEKILGSKVGDRWQHVVDRDEIRVRERSYGPLSRGYSGTNSVVPTLDTKRGAELATEAAREAAKRAKLAPERAEALKCVASEIGSQYTKEIERAIGSRLLSDPDFDKQSFPKAAKRFLPKGSSA